MARNLFYLVVFGVLITGCNDSVTWVEQPNQSLKCDKEDIDYYKKSDSANSLYSIMGEKYCPNAGKGQFTGEIRCKNGSMQFACKSD